MLKLVIWSILHNHDFFQSFEERKLVQHVISQIFMKMVEEKNVHPCMNTKKLHQ